MKNVINFYNYNYKNAHIKSKLLIIVITLFYF